MNSRLKIILFSTIAFWQSCMGIQPTSSFPIPKTIEFADQSISLERYDMRERFDREQLIIAYGHSTSIMHIKRANKYFPIIEPILKQNGIPTDFKYLAVIESSLDPRAISPAQAAGLWQLMPKTAQQFGLEVNEEVDERYNIEKATVAACKYLKSAYNKYKNWTTVAASYNGGMGRISEELEKQQVSESFDLLLTSETSRYVFRLLAMKQFMENPQKFGFQLQREDFYPSIKTKNVVIKDSVADWTTWAAKYGISYYQLKDFNIWLRGRKLANPTAKEYVIQVPDKDDFKYDVLKIQIYNQLWVIF